MTIAVTSEVLDRARGAFLGLAVGDALGTTLEFSARDSRPAHTDMTGGGPFGLEPGHWTDDTSMALALADSLITRGSFDGRDLMDRFLAWWRTGAYSCTGRCFDIGITTREALARYERHSDPFAGAVGEDKAGNGSLMRLAPVALHALQDAAEARRIARDQSRTTHGAPQAVEACAFFVDLLREAILGAGKAKMLAARAWAGHPAIAAVAGGGWRGKTRDEISSSGYVVATLEAAIWCLAQAEDFEGALIRAVNLADDADTVGAVTGQLAGALYGAGGIPGPWLERLAWRDRIEGMATALLEARQPPRS